MAKKIAEIDVHFIRLPFVSDDYLKSGVKSIVDGVLWLAQQTSFTGGKRLWSENPRLREITWGFWCCTLDVYSEGTPVPWQFIAGAIVGAVVAGAIIYYVQVRPLEEAMVEISKDISDVQQELMEAYSQGLIDKDTYVKISSKLEEAQMKASQAGSTDWTKYLYKIFEYLPMILAVFLIITIVDVLRRR
ncbi:MAG: hypothetical protein QXT64_02425 [Desulfurococcaceae archaeon]